MQKKLLVFGIDGGTFTVINPLIKKGKLPFFEKLLREGFSGELESVYPPITAPAWVSFFTGKNPANHGVLDFTFQDVLGHTKIYNYSMVSGPTIFEIFEKEKIKQAIINVPATWPAPKISGEVITGLLTPDKNKAFFPETLKEELKKNGINYRVDAKDFPKGREKEFLEDMNHVSETQKNAIKYILKTRKPDILYYVFRSTDSASHNFWKYYDKKHPLHKKKTRTFLKKAVESMYIKADKILKEVFESYNFSNILVISDHGFGPCKGQILLNNFFIKKKYIKFKESAEKSFPGLLEKTGFTYGKAKKLLKKLGLFDFIKSKLKPDTRARIAGTFLSFKDIDWKKTRAFCAGNHGQVFINKKLFKNKKELDLFKKKLKKELMELKNPETNQKLFEKIFEKKEIFKGKFSFNAPDFYLVPKDKKLIVFSSISSTRKLVENVFENSGEHRQKGVFLLWGKNIRHGKSNAKIIDIAPTILYLFNLSIHNEMDGKPIISAFKEKRPVKKKNYAFEKKQKIIFSEKENLKIKEQLKGMGYFT